MPTIPCCLPPAERYPGLRDEAVKRLPGQRVSDDRPHSDQSIEIDAGAEAHRLKHEDQVLGHDIARGAGSERTSAEATERRVERRQPGLERGQHVGESQAARIVAVDAGHRVVAAHAPGPA